MKIYICSPYRGNIKTNIRNAQECCRKAVLRHHLPIAPHLYFPQFLNDKDESERALGINYAMSLLNKCDQLWICSDKISEGMSAEIAEAKKLGIRVRTYDEVKEIIGV